MKHRFMMAEEGSQYPRFGGWVAKYFSLLAPQTFHHHHHHHHHRHYHHHHHHPKPKTQNATALLYCMDGSTVLTLARLLICAGTKRISHIYIYTHNIILHVLYIYMNSPSQKTPQHTITHQCANATNVQHQDMTHLSINFGLQIQHH